MRNWRHEELAIVRRVLLAGAKVVTFVLVDNVVSLTVYVIHVWISADINCWNPSHWLLGTVPRQFQDSLGTVPGQSPVLFLYGRKEGNLLL